jgi:hypothetical protein
MKMPLFDVPKNPPTPDPNPTNPIPNLYPKQYRHSVVSAKTTPLSALLQYVEGSTLIVDYYAQVLGADEEASPFEPGQLAVYQQYNVIKGMVIKLDGSFSIGEDQQSMEMQVSGTGKIFPGTVKPNFGDVIIADIGDGKAGIFTLEVPLKNTLMKETCYNITFNLYKEADENLISILNSRVVNTYYYKSDFLTYGKNPIVTEGVVQLDKQLKYLEKTRLREFIADFFSREYGTFVVPSQSDPTYDRYVVSCLMRQFDRNVDKVFSRVRELNCDGLPLSDQYSVFDMLISRDESYRNIIFTRAQLASVRLFDSLPYMEGIRFSGMKYAVLPKTLRNVVESQYTRAACNYIGTAIRQETSVYDVTANVDYLEALSGLTAMNEDDAVLVGYSDPLRPVYHKMGSDDSYVLSNAFYDEDVDNMTKFDLLVHSAITKNMVSIRPLLAMANVISKWPALDRYYYTPLLIGLLQLSKKVLS